MKKQSPPISNEDKSLFEEAVKGIKPIVHDKVDLRQQRLKPNPRTTVEVPSLDLVPTEQVKGGQTIEFAQNEINSRDMKQLRAGHFELGATLDLHGETVKSATPRLLSFLNEASGAHEQYVRIIHGQGYGSKQEYPAMKNLVNQILRSHPSVLAFCSCLPQHGGLGAVNVRLR